MSHLKDPSSSSSASGGLRAITINGAIHVESEEELARRRERRRRERRSRWGRPAEAQLPQLAPPQAKRSAILLPEDDATAAAATATKPAPPAQSASASASSANIQVNCHLYSDLQYFLGVGWGGSGGRGGHRSDD